jgi:hypothetical protein
MVIYGDLRENVWGELWHYGAILLSATDP